MSSLGNKATQIDLAYQKDRRGGAALVAKQGMKTEIDTGREMAVLATEATNDTTLDRRE